MPIAAPNILICTSHVLSGIEAIPAQRECARSPWLPWSLSVLSTADLNACRSGLSCSAGARQKLCTARSCTARHGFPQQSQL
jgi:hypothetical protein